LKLRVTGLLPVTEVMTYAAPRVGGGDFAARYAAQHITDYRYENQNDLVPLLPLDKLELQMLPLLDSFLGMNAQQTGDYVSVGQLRYITVDGSVIAPKDAATETQLDQSRMQEFGALLLQDRENAASTIVNAHAIGDPGSTDTSRYYRAVCGSQSAS